MREPALEGSNCWEMTQNDDPTRIYTSNCMH
jgi:hypothetical protein